jgi:TonB family protein
MYSPIREEVGLKLNMPWEKNTANGFGLSLLIGLVFLIILGTFVSIDAPVKKEIEIPVISTLEIINFGDGDGTGVSKGNLTAEGSAHLGSQVPSNLHDAIIAANTQAVANPSNADPENAQNFNPTQNMTGTQTKNGELNGNGTSNVGSPTGTAWGTGLGNKGAGKGLGLGLGDIEWGGGGNRTVLKKELPKFPNGAKAGQVKISFTVAADGTVMTARPTLKGGDPNLERAAIQALKYWRFNPLKEKKDMQGVITFTFNLK